MNDLTWNYVKPLKDPNAVDHFLEQNHIELEQNLIDLLKNHNGGRPSPDTFDTSLTKERVFKALLSYNMEDRETIYKCYSKELKERALFPLATDPAGNYICIDLGGENDIVFFETESLGKERVANSFEEFINQLYK